MSNGNSSSNGSNGSNGKGKRGRKPRSVSPVNLTVEIHAEARMKTRLENLIDDLPQAAEIVSDEDTDTGFLFVLRYGTGPEGRLARKAIAQSLRKLRDKGRIVSARLATNEIVIG